MYGNGVALELKRFLPRFLVDVHSQFLCVFGTRRGPNLAVVSSNLQVGGAKAAQPAS